MNPRAVIALALLVVMFLATFVARIVIHYRRTGSSGIVGISDRPGSLEWWGHLIFELALFVGTPATALLQLNDRAGRVASLSTIIGAGLMIVGIVGIGIAQATMGSSWRVGVDTSEKTTLVTKGIFGFVRNPIYTAMVLAILGVLVLVPSLLAFVTFVALVLSLHVQVRLAEEPYLLALHGDAYRNYAARVGRFWPRIGRLRSR
jgi:protein-S-isoprenylcysteine O-methyltransferase Ste14